MFRKNLTQTMSKFFNICKGLTINIHDAVAKCCVNSRCSTQIL